MARYGADVAAERRGSCRPAVAAQLKEMGALVESAGRGHRPGDDRLISAWQNARVVANGEAYYRIVYAGGVVSWNLRDTHMADTIDALATHLNEGSTRPAKLIVWAHNSHLGDARVTERSEVGEWNVGQLMRQRHDGQAVLIGFTTYGGTVRAASRWGSEGTEQPLRAALPGSFSALFHELGVPAFSLRLRGERDAVTALGQKRLERFVGVVYAPATERQSHYFEADLARQYDAVVHIDRTTAVAVPRTGPTARPNEQRPSR
jgi:erythromycin esterase-like protein